LGLLRSKQNASPNCNVNAAKEWELGIELMRKSQTRTLDRQYEINKQAMCRDAQLTLTGRGKFRWELSGNGEIWGNA